MQGSLRYDLQFQQQARDRLRRQDPDHRGERALFRLLRPRDRQLLCLRHERQQGRFRRPERHYEAQRRRAPVWRRCD